MSNRKLYPLIYKYVPKLIEAGADHAYLQNLNNQIEACYDRQSSIVRSDLDILLHDMFGVGVIHSTSVKNGCRFDYYTDSYGKIKLQLKTYLSGSTWGGDVALYSMYTSIAIETNITKTKKIYTGVPYNHKQLCSISKKNIQSNDKDTFINYLMTSPMSVNYNYVANVKHQLNAVIIAIQNAKAILDTGASYNIIV